MGSFLPSDSCKETQLNTPNPLSWLQVERGKLSKSCASYSFSSSICISRIHEELETCAREERSNLYLLQFQVFRGLREVKLMRRSLRAAWQNAATVHEKLIFGSWLKYQKQGEEHIADLLVTCGKCLEEFGPVNVASMVPVDSKVSPEEMVSIDDTALAGNVTFKIGNERIVCDRRKIAELSPPFRAMFSGCFSEATLEDIDLPENNISSSGKRAIRNYSLTGDLTEDSPDLLLEILIFACRFCCERLKDACVRKLESLVLSRDDAVEFTEYALEQNSSVLSALCLRIFILEIPDCLDDDRVVQIFSNANEQELSTVDCRLPCRPLCRWRLLVWKGGLRSTRGSRCSRQEKAKQRKLHSKKKTKKKKDINPFEDVLIKSFVGYCS